MACERVKPTLNIFINKYVWADCVLLYINNIQRDMPIKNFVYIKFGIICVTLLGELSFSL